MRVLRLSIWILLLPVVFTACRQNSDTDDQRPNVILIMADDFGYADISFEGNTQIKTPNIDRIAECGARFSRFYQSSGACSPTRASLLTGRYYLKTGVWGVHYGRDFMRRDETTVADVLNKTGYATGAFGKWHNGKTWSYFSWNRGFDVGMHPVLYRYFDSRVLFNNKLVNIEGPVTDVIGDQVVKFIRDNKDSSFFCYVPFQSIHEPFNCPDDVFRKYKTQGYTNHMARLYGMIEVMDDNIGKILNTVDELGLAENTVIMFLSDDGPSPGFDLSYSGRRMNPEERQERRNGWARKLRGGKASIWEGGSITPFYIRWKNHIPEDKQYDQLTGVIDLFPTILDICGLEIPAGNLPVDGKSFWPLIQGEVSDDWEERMYFDNSNFYQIPRSEINMDYPDVHHISVHYKDYKLVRTDHTHFGADTISYSLFNLAKDPGEESNIYGEEPGMATLLRDAIDNWYQDILDSDRAFGRAVYEVGHWEERGSPINLDGVRDIKGTVQRSQRSEFMFDGWTDASSAMSFEIDVVEAGNFHVELLYDCKTADFGSVFKVYTAHDTARVEIDHVNYAFSDTLRLPSGRQILSLELEKTGKGRSAVEVMKKLVVHRIPGAEEGGVIRNPGFTLAACDTTTIHPLANAVADFMIQGGNQDELLFLDHGELIEIEPSSENMDQIESIEIFIDFESITKLKEPPFKFSIDTLKKGSSTLNIEFTSMNGVKNSVRANLKVE